MSGEYRKYTVEMELILDDYRLWKRGMDGSICMLESYKAKRSIYFSASNLLPSANLLETEGKEYHLVLMGAENGELIHRDFGAFYVNQRGEGSFFKKFEGPELLCYTHCLFLAMDTEGGKAETILSGVMPFANLEDDLNVKEENQTEAFGEKVDETGAIWYRIDDVENIPQYLQDAEALIKKYNHYILGKKDGGWFVGVPGRFLKCEQPGGEKGKFQLWQPLRGGEKYYKDSSELTGKLCEEIFGYWVAGIDRERGILKEL